VDGPVRTCVGCRKYAAKSTLIRMVSAGDGVVIDLPQSAPGRGAYLHPVPGCLDLAVRRRAVGRALRVPAVDSDALTDRLGPVLLTGDDPDR